MYGVALLMAIILADLNMFVHEGITLAFLMARETEAEAWLKNV